MTIGSAKRRRKDITTIVTPAVRSTGWRGSREIRSARMDVGASLNTDEMARSELRSNIKFKRLTKRLELPVPYVIGLLECMWQVGYQSGSDEIGTAEDVELAAEWPGKPGVFFDAIRQDWLDERSGVYAIHDLYEHAPEYAKKKMDRRSLQNKDLRQKTADNVRQKPPNVGSTQPNLTQPNQTEIAAATAADELAKRKPASGDHHELIRFFSERWKILRNAEYVFGGGKDGKNIQKLLANCGGSLDQAKAVVERFFADNDPWIVEHGHQLGMLVSGFNKYRAGPVQRQRSITKAVRDE